MSAQQEYDRLRPQAFAVAYRMLGTVSEAEDVVQEAFLRMHKVTQQGEQIDNPEAYVTTLVTRLAIDQLRSARKRREGYVGEWLPEPLATGAGPDEQAETSDSLSLAFLVLLESLTPKQRAAFLLREVFAYPYEEVAEIIGIDVDSARHLVSRARSGIRERRPRYLSTRQERDELARRFLAAAQQGDLHALEEMLAEDVVLRADGGGKAQALAKPVNGARRVARTIATGVGSLAEHGLEIVTLELNGQPGAAVVGGDGHLVAVMGLDIVAGKVQTINAIANPDKLAHLSVGRS